MEEMQGFEGINPYEDPYEGRIKKPQGNEF